MGIRPDLKIVLLICSHLQQFSKIISPPTAPCLRPDNVNGMRNPAPINHFPPTLFSLNRSPIYEDAHLFSQPASRLVTGNPSVSLGHHSRGPALALDSIGRLPGKVDANIVPAHDEKL